MIMIIHIRILIFIHIFIHIYIYILIHILMIMITIIDFIVYISFVFRVFPQEIHFKIDRIGLNEKYFQISALGC